MLSRPAAEVPAAAKGRLGGFLSRRTQTSPARAAALRLEGPPERARMLLLKGTFRAAVCPLTHKRLAADASSSARGCNPSDRREIADWEPPIRAPPTRGRQCPQDHIVRLRHIFALARRRLYLSSEHMGETWEAGIPAALNEIGALIRDEYRRIPVLQRDLPCLRCLVDVHAPMRDAGEEPEILRTYLVTPDIWREITPRPKPSNATCGGYHYRAREYFTLRGPTKGRCAICSGQNSNLSPLSSAG